MQGQSLKRVGSFHKRCHPVAISPLTAQRSILYQTQNTEMATQSKRRSMCPACSKPTRLCLCTRLKVPKLHNSIAVTILQHSLEKKHPLNSTRIASIALQNLSVIPVSDVNSQARFLIRRLFNSNLERSSSCDQHVVGFAVDKYGTVLSFQDVWMMENGSQPRCGFDRLLASREAVDDLSKGFVVKKLQTKPLRGGIGLEGMLRDQDEEEENEEFEIRVGAGSVLLFPSERAVRVEDLRGVEVRNLVVLDGTWSKAKRMYKENPWLKLLPHVKLDVLDGMSSLYGEVRHQPKEGYFSTIESIVYALKALGEKDDEDSKGGLDDLLDVFVSMVADQRRCKDERLRQANQTNFL
ncbi:unnamed protein product [Cuscuta epithymum]|uniref:tRNA-uridine aminocarboxypropyltransferase n=1 Tax=Cuscuta epithymum TaxID=186058 RepID=A0AAV0C1B9_9ASTE|nr:unnamed protein product [Cuscuta epithymum]